MSRMSFFVAKERLFSVNRRSFETCELTVIHHVRTGFTVDWSIECSPRLIIVSTHSMLFFPFVSSLFALFLNKHPYQQARLITAVSVPSPIIVSRLTKAIIIGAYRHTSGVSTRYIEQPLHGKQGKPYSCTAFGLHTITRHSLWVKKRCPLCGFLLSPEMALSHLKHI